MKILLSLFFLFISTSHARSNMQIPLNTDVDHLFKTIKKANAQNLVEAISLLSDDYFKKNQYALIFDSLSPQTSGPEAPRVLLFGKDRKLRLGFNHQRKEGKELEVIQWREASQTWEFREIKFTKAGPTMSPVNPKLCLECHNDHKPQRAFPEK